MSLPSQSANSSGPAKGPWYWSGPALQATTDLLFPPRCASCSTECLLRPGEPLLCEACSAELAPATRPACLRCAKHCQESDVLAGSCFECRGRKLLIDGARTLGPYEGPLRDAVLRIKHYQYEPLARALGVRLAENLRRQPFDPPPEVIAPVPMHWLKRLWRGTNAPDTLALSLASAIGLRAATGLLVCRRILRRQSTLRPDERRRNVRGAYRVALARNLKGVRVLLLDDVMTTGATAHDAARALRKAGAAAVYFVAVARSTGDF